MRYPSELPFASLCWYSPYGKSTGSRRSKTFCDAIKNDRAVLATLRDGSVGQMRAVEVVALRLEEMAVRPEFAFLAQYFGAKTVVVPIPRSAPLKDPNALWPARELCKAIVAQGLACEMSPLLERVLAVPKSALAKSGAERASPDQHFQSTAVQAALQLFRGRTLVLVDDVITRGSTMIGMHARLQEAFSSAEVKCFAALRSMGPKEIESVYEPVQGVIRFVNNHLHREP